MKGKGERESYAQLNAEFQRIAKRDKKVFLSKQCKEIEESSRMGKPSGIPTQNTSGHVSDEAQFS